MNELKNIKAIIFDLDGTLYSGSEPIADAVETLAYLKKKSIDIFYLTNNSTKSPEHIKARLEKMGFTPPLEKIYTSLSASVSTLSRMNIKKVYCVGAPELVSELEANGIEVVNDKPDISVAEAVLVGMDTGLTYKKIADAYKIFQLNPACKFIACNADNNYPVENGIRMPGAGPCVAAIAEASGKKVDLMVGKPEPYMINLLSGEWKLAKDEILMVGDSSSDELMAHNFGCRSAILYDGKEYDKATYSIQSLKILQEWF